MSVGGFKTLCLIALARVSFATLDTVSNHQSQVTSNLSEHWEYSEESGMLEETVDEGQIQQELDSFWNAIDSEIHRQDKLSIPKGENYSHSEWPHFYLLYQTCFFSKHAQNHYSETTANYITQSQENPLINNLYLAPNALTGDLHFLNRTLPLGLSMQCTMDSCFDWEKCVKNTRWYHDNNSYPGETYSTINGRNTSSIGPKFYLYNTSKPYTNHRHATLMSAFEIHPWRTTNPNEACLFIPDLNLLTPNTSVNLEELEHWNHGRNHVLVTESEEELQTWLWRWNVTLDRAILASANHRSSFFRRYLDVSLPLFPPKGSNAKVEEDRKFFASFQSYNQSECTPFDLSSLSSSMKPSSDFTESIFAVIPRGCSRGNTQIIQALRDGAIPVLLIDEFVPHFQDLIPEGLWISCILHIPETQIHRLFFYLTNVVVEERRRKCAELSKWFDGSDDEFVRVSLLLENVKSRMWFYL
jgi:hypothetical protein